MRWEDSEEIEQHWKGVDPISERKEAWYKALEDEWRAWVIRFLSGITGYLRVLRK